MHRHTPAITVYDARGATARTVVYCRRSAADDPQPRITQTVDDFKHRASHVRDPRLFALLQDDPATPSNHTTIASLSGGALLSVNVDAGWHLSLPGASGQPLQSWDQKLNQHRTVYDALLRPAFVFEAANDQGEWRAECFSYADANTESARHNRCGQLIRHDDTVGTQLFNEFDILGAPLEQAWRFLNTPQVPDWPLDPLERDALLEAESAVSHTGYNALGEQTRHLDAAGHEQYVRQTLAGELAAIGLKMAGARQETTLVGEIHYNAEGQIEQQTAGNQVVTRCSFDPESGRLSRLLAISLTSLRCRIWRTPTIPSAISSVSMMALNPFVTRAIIYRTVRYSGQERDATGLYYYGFRYYLPWRQRWLSADPGGVHDGLNLYRMVGGNPIGFVDLQGLAKTRVTPTQRLKAIPSGMGRGIVKGAAGYTAKYVAKTVMKLAAREALRSAAMILSGASWAYASAGLAGHYLEAAGVSRISKGLGMGRRIRRSRHSKT
jgi:insecticidal toxin complex protein TccC